MANRSGRVRVTKRDSPYVNIDKTSLNDASLSWGAKGLLAYVLSLPPDWVLYLSELHTHSTVGYSGTVTYMDELIRAGYIKRISLRNEKGHFEGYDYDFLETPLPMEERTVLKEKYKRPKKDKPKMVDTEHGNSKYGTTKDGETLSKDYTQDKLINKQTNKDNKVSVVTDTPPLESNLNLSEIPTGSEKTEKPINLSLKEKSRNEKVNSGGGGENSQSNVGNSNKPKKQPVQRLNLATLTDTQKAEINAVLLKYDSVNDAKAAWIKWLEHKSKAGGKIKQYLNHETALTALELASKQAQYQSEALTDAVNEAIANEFMGLYLSKHVKKTYQNGTTNGKIDRATANNAYMERIRRGEDLPYK